MKTSLTLFVLISTLFLSCDKDRNLYGNGNTQTYGIIDATINGYTWSALSGYASYNNFTLRLYGEGPNGSALEITIYPYNGLGSYAVSSPAQIYYLDVDGYQYNASTGNVTIESDANGQVSGYFNFGAVASGSSTYIDMAGDFNLYY